MAGSRASGYELIEIQVAAQKLPEAMLKEVASINESLKGGKEVTDVPVYLQSLFRASVQPYLISWYKYNPSDYYCCFESTRSDCTGKTDIQVSVEDAELLKKACPAARFLLIDRMNHVFERL